MAALAVAALSAQVAARPPEKADDFKPGQPVQQPLPFSHKTHVGLGLTCLECHAIEAPGDFAGFPSETKCMACHIAVKTGSPHIQKLAAAAEAAQPIAWKRVYQVKEFVYFSHQVHYREAGIPCSECHGPVAERDVLFQETSLSMYACMKCHESHQAPTGCDLCHDTH
jgi:Cytochrome c7 and related cytochrome c